MKYSQAQFGRVFVVRLEDGDILHACLEDLAQREGVRAGAVIIVGGADIGSHLVVGPTDGRSAPVVPMEHILRDVHEVCGTGTIFPDEAGAPVLHLHLAAGREDWAVVGCVRRGVKTWHVIEAIIWELVGTNATRRPDPATGFSLLQP